jgi:hypothetical protein
MIQASDMVIRNGMLSTLDFNHRHSSKGRMRMKLLTGAVATVSSILLACSVASANPALLPKHDGYPMKNDGSPVNGQPTANDPGQKDAHGTSTLLRSAESVQNAEQKLVKTDNARITEGHGAGRLPNVEGPQIQIAPPVTSATKITGDRQID